MQANAKRNQIIIDHLPLVRAIAVRVHETLPVYIDLNDLINAGVLGLFQAVRNYSADKKVGFGAFARHRIKGAILDSLRQMDWATRDLRKRQKQVDATTRELTAKLSRVPTEEELAEFAGMDLERWRKILFELKTTGLAPTPGKPRDTDAPPEQDPPAGPELRPDNICERAQLKETLRSAMSALPERYRSVVTLYYSRDLTMKEIAEEIGVNESRVSQIHKSALAKMACVLHRSGIHSASCL